MVFSSKVTTREKGKREIIACLVFFSPSCTCLFVESSRVESCVSQKLNGEGEGTARSSFVHSNIIFSFLFPNSKENIYVYYIYLSICLCMRELTQSYAYPSIHPPIFCLCSINLKNQILGFLKRRHYKNSSLSLSQFPFTLRPVLSISPSPSLLLFSSQAPRKKAYS